MGAKILTGYTGEKHITPLDDAAVYRSIMGQDSYVLDEGEKCVAVMPSINEFTMYSGLISIQGIQARISRDTLSIDTCPTGKARIDLVVARYTHDTTSLIDDVELIVLKGPEVDDTNDPTAPAYNIGRIEDGATLVDMPLYRINLKGGSVTFDKMFAMLSGKAMQNIRIDIPSFSALPVTVTDSRITEDHICKPGDCQLSNPSAQRSDWTVTTSEGALTLSGTISGTTTAILYLTIPQ